MNLKLDTLGKKIGIGFALVTLVLITAVIITILQVRNVDQTAQRIIDLRVPTVRASSELNNGINHSIAALRGWIIINENSYREERKEAWDQEIDIALSRLESLSETWTNPENVERLNLLRPKVDQLRIYQNEVEVLAESDKDTARDLLEGKGAPIVFEIRNILDEMVADQEGLMTTDFVNVNEQISLLSNIEWVLLALGILISLMLAYFITRSVTKPVSNAVVVARNIGQGDLETNINVGGSKELETLGDALIEMRDSLIKKTEETERYDWLTTGQNKLNEAMRGDRIVEELTNAVAKFLAEYTASAICGVYLADESGKELNLSGKYAFDSDEIQEKFRFGEGLIGQVAADKQSISLSGMEEKDIRLKSLVLDAVPRNVFVTPFLFEGQILGVIELGKFEKYDDTQREFIETSMESIGIALNSAIASEKIKNLLEETQRQSEELQQQQEELEQTNEELEEQTQKLKEQQEELQASNEELEEQTQVVEQKNRDLEVARTDIELKAKQLEISSKYKSEFLANMSHELRTPLNSLLILSNDLANNKTGNLNEEQVESAEVISKSGNDLLNLINEILDLSKIEAGKMDLNLREVNISELADNLHRNFKRNAEAKKITFETILEEALPQTVKTDLQRLDQILKNLLSNAIKFTEKGSVTVTFRKEAGGNLAIAVKDTGIGIAHDKLDVIFEAFQQADGSTARKYGGTGLGLSISRELAKLLGGKISLESTPGKGSEFTLFIPLDVENSNEIKITTPPRAVAKKTVIESTGKYLNYPAIEDERDQIKQGDHVILIIEDDKDFARVLASQAKSKGFRYLAASTGEDGLVLAGQYKPQAILLDIDLPGINGHLVLKELKGNPDLRHIPVHILSVNEKTLDPIRSGAVEYLTKPVTKEQLENAFGRIEDFVNRKMKNLLIVEDNDNLRKSIVKLIGNGDVKCYEAGTATDALAFFDKEPVDCMVLDIGLPDMSGFELIKMLEKKFGERIPPVIIYTGKELTREENEELEQYADAIIVKGVKSEERLLDETALFLHRTVRNLPQSKRNMITALYDKEAMFQGKKILLVDDDMRNIFALGKVLKEKGLEIIKAENGRVALDALDQHPDVDLVLMDVMMPEMDGYECMREIRKQKHLKNMPIISLTAKAMKDDRQKCIDAGANDYIAKPVDVERLLSLMRIWIKR